MFLIRVLLINMDLCLFPKSSDSILAAFGEVKETFVSDFSVFV